MADSIKTCRKCRHLAAYPRNNSYHDVDYLCLKTGYFCSGIDKDITKVKRYSPGGRELKCEFESKNKEVLDHETGITGDRAC